MLLLVSACTLLINACNASAAYTVIMCACTSGAACTVLKFACTAGAACTVLFACTAGAVCTVLMFACTAGAACTVLYLFSVDTESLTGPQAVRRAVSGLLCSVTVRPTPVHFKVGLYHSSPLQGRLTPLQCTSK